MKKLIFFSLILSATSYADDLDIFRPAKETEALRTWGDQLKDPTSIETMGLVYLTPEVNFGDFPQPELVSDPASRVQTYLLPGNQFFWLNNPEKKTGVVATWTTTSGVPMWKYWETEISKLPAKNPQQSAQFRDLLVTRIFLGTTSESYKKSYASSDFVELSQHHQELLRNLGIRKVESVPEFCLKGGNLIPENRFVCFPQTKYDMIDGPAALMDWLKKLYGGSSTGF
jgi:hypothetical protein